MKLRPYTSPEHWPGALHALPHSRALLIREATDTRFWFTPEECRRKCSRKGSEAKRQRESIWRRYQRYGFVRCRWCGEAMTREEMTKDHVIARCFGGCDILENIVPACAACNHQRSLEQSRLMNELWIEWTIAELRTIPRRSRPEEKRRRHRRGDLGRNDRRRRPSTSGGHE